MILSILFYLNFSWLFFISKKIETCTGKFLILLSKMCWFLNQMHSKYARSWFIVCLEIIPIWILENLFWIFWWSKCDCVSGTVSVYNAPLDQQIISAKNDTNLHHMIRKLLIHNLSLLEKEWLIHPAVHYKLDKILNNHIFEYN